MKKDHSLLIMFHCEQFTGYAIEVLEKVFVDAAQMAGYSEDSLFFSYKSIVDSIGGKVIGCDYYNVEDSRDLMHFIKNNSINKVIAFDMPYPVPVLKILRLAGVEEIISYWGAGISSINQGVKLLIKRIEWYVRAVKPDYFIFESEAMRRTATHGRGIPARRTCVIPLGVDTSVYKPNYGKDNYAHTVLGIPEHHKIVFYSGHMEERKGVGVIVRAAMYLINVLDNKDVHFVMCGNKGNEADIYLQLLNGDEANHHVTFAGYRGDIAGLMRSSFIGVIASTGWDSFTMSSVEMMASGLPLIVSNLQGLAETIEDNKNGFHIEPGDYQDLAKKIDYLAKDIELATLFSNASRTRAVEKFSREFQVKQMCSVLTHTSDNQG